MSILKRIRVYTVALQARSTGSLGRFAPMTWEVEARDKQEAQERAIVKATRDGYETRGCEGVTFKDTYYKTGPRVYLCYIPAYWGQCEAFEAASSFDARKAFAAKHACQITDVAAVVAVKRDGFWQRAEDLEGAR